MSKKVNIIWIIVLVAVVTGQWVIHNYNLTERLFSEGNMESERKVAYWAAPMDPDYVSDKPGKSPMGMDLVPVYEDELAGTDEGVAGVDYYYTCGMHPNIQEKEPGICPICNMNLVKKTVSGGGSPGQVAIDPVTVQNMGVKTVTVEKRPLLKTIRAYGKIEYDETLISSVTTKVQGWVERLYLDYPGKYVKKGDPVIEFYSPELVSTQGEYLQALKFNKVYESGESPSAINNSRELLNSTKQRLKLWDITDEQITELENSGEIKRNMTLYAPTSGIVIHKEINEGDRVVPDRHMFRIADITRVWIQTDIYESDMPWIKEGQTAKLTVPSLPGREFEGRLSFIYPYLESKTRTVRARFEFDNREGLLKPEMYANVMIGSGDINPRLVVPVSSVLLTGERSVVIVDLGEGKFEPREVRIGMESDDYYSILDGLEEGERLVTSAQFLIDSESRLREAQMKMFSPESADSEEIEVKTVVTLIGDGEMKYTCPMPEDMVFSSQPGDCPECGMKLTEMTPEQAEQMHKLMESHEVERFDNSEQLKDEHQGHSHSPVDEQSGDTDHQTVLFFGEGEMTHFCPMEEDLVFSDSNGSCPRCGMFLAEMGAEEKKNMENLIKGHEMIRIQDVDDVSIDELAEYKSFTEMSLIFIGEGEMTHYCPMEEDKVFASGEERCPRCGMKLRKMDDAQKEKMRKLMETHEVIRISSTYKIKIEKGENK
ncbi:efflux RND transporter periplasmic adaptor subunit [candidate division KSB1 bacterium]